MNARGVCCPPTGILVSGLGETVGCIPGEIAGCWVGCIPGEIAGCWVGCIPGEIAGCWVGCRISGRACCT